MDNPLQLVEPDGGWPDEDRTRNVSSMKKEKTTTTVLTLTSNLIGLNKLVELWKRDGVSKEIKCTFKIMKMTRMYIPPMSKTRISTPPFSKQTFRLDD